MSREIKFRAWDKGRREFLSGGQILLSIEKGRNPQNGFYLDIFDERYKDKYKDRFVLQQYTGLKDKNGKEIYEGDIVAFTDTYSTDNGYAEMDCIGVVGWEDEELCFYVTERLSAESWEVLQECVVIGNIFDNPELLGGDSD